MPEVPWKPEGNVVQCSHAGYAGKWGERRDLTSTNHHPPAVHPGSLLVPTPDMRALRFREVDVCTLSHTAKMPNTALVQVPFGVAQGRQVGGLR